MKTLCICAVLAVARPLTAQPAGTVIAWGEDYYGGGVAGSTNVVGIAGRPLTNAVAIAAGASHSLALTADGTLVGWGANAEGEAVGYKTPDGRHSGRVEIGGRPLAGVTAFAASKSTANSFSIALTSDGTVVVWGEGRQGQTAAPAGLSNVTAVSAGELQALALNADGTVASWGWGNPAPPGLSNVVAISAAGIAGRNLALTRDGRVVDWWARPSVYDSKVPEGLGNIIAISAGWSHGLALRNDGTVVGWGSDDVGQATGVSHTAGGSQATGLVMVAGQVVSNVVAVAAAHDFSLALKKDGTVASWGRSFGVALPAGLDGVVVISAAGYYCLAITTNPAVAARFRPSSAERSQ